MKKAFIVPFVVLAIAFSSCGGNQQESTSSSETDQVSENLQVESVPGAENLETNNSLILEGNDQMKFDKELFKVKAREEVNLIFKNVGELPKESMGHNVVILKPNVDVTTFGSEAVSAADNDYIPKTSLSSVVAHTRLLGPGEEDQISFTLEPGVYPFICSFPGHFGVMQGKIVAE